MNAFYGYRFNTEKEDLNSDRSANLITNLYYTWKI